MHTTSLTLATPRDFHFWRTAFSHGWCSLPPFSFDPDKKTLSRTLELAGGLIVDCTLRDASHGVSIAVTSESALAPSDRKEIRTTLASCLELNFDLAGFYRHASRFAEFRWIPKSGSGRMLRCPTVFEDALKIICTTNCTWALTTIMVTNLTRTAGHTQDGTHYSFPSATAVSALSERELRQQCKTGYRAPFIKEFAGRVASGELDVESWRASDQPTPELIEEIGAIKGMGPYAVGNMLRLLYRHDSLALDSWVRSQFFRLHKKGRKVNDRVIERHYEKYGEWRGLMFWLEMVRHWHDGKFRL